MVERWKTSNMACCLPPESSAVLIALAHVRELEKQLKEEQYLFSPEASVHLEGISAAVTELEAIRCAANQYVQIQIIENDKLRSHIISVSEQMSQHILMEVRAARKCCTQETEALCKYLDSISERREAALNVQETIMSHNDSLQLQLEEFKGEQIQLMAGLKDRITSEHNFQKKLDDTVKQTEKLKCCTAAVVEDRVTLQSNFQMERENLLVYRDKLCMATHLTKEKMMQQKQVLLIKDKVLDRVNQKKLDTINHLGEFMVYMARLKSDMHEKAMALCQSEEQLRVEIQKQEHLRQESQCFINELSRMRNSYKIAIQFGKEELEKLGGLIERGQSSRMPFQDSVAEILEVLHLKQEEENQIKLEHLHIKQQLERSELQLEECLASNHKHKNEASEFDGKIRDLLKAGTVTKDMLEKNLKELLGHVDKENQDIGNLEEEKQKLAQLLDKAKVEQERQVTSISSDISKMRRKYKELQHKEAKFLHLHPTYAHPDQLLQQMTLCEREYKQLEHMHIQEIVKCTTETDTISSNIYEKRQLLEKRGKMLMEMEAKCTELRSRHHGLQRLSSELKSRGNNLEASTQRLKENTSLMLRHQKQTKGELEKVRAARSHRLYQQTAELKQVEVTIYNHEVKLEQVRKENSLIRLHIRKMTKEVRRSKQNVDYCKMKKQRFHQDMHEVMERLHTAWRKDHLLIEHSQSRDNVFLAFLDDMLNHLKAHGDLPGQFDNPPSVTV